MPAGLKKKRYGAPRKKGSKKGKGKKSPRY
jgi:hypothetical protein